MERKKRDESLDVFWTRIMSWDGFIAAIDDIEDLTEQEKDQAKEAYRFLSKELNHEFIKELRKKNHPFLQELSNQIAPMKRWVIKFAQFVKSINSSPKFKKLKSNLVSKYYHTLSEIKIMMRFHDGDFITEIYPDVLIEGKRKEADIKIIDLETGQELIVEVSQLESSKKEGIVAKIWGRIRETVRTINSNLSVSVIVHNKIDDGYLDGMLEKIRKIILVVANTKSFQSYSEEHLIDVGISYSNDDEDYLQWCGEKNTSPNQFGEDFISIDEITRLEIKMSREIREQLPQDQPCVLVIYSNVIFGMYDSYQQYLTALEQLIYKYQNLVALVLASDWTSFGESELRTYNDNYFIIDNEHILGGWRYFIWNKNSKFRLPDNVIKKLLESFTIRK
ncbi:MAG: hypothetical protein GNW80_16805 [Asgard group archaeon]|nr:hypothetical protein [Asgard group archaeon]